MGNTQSSGDPRKEEEAEKKGTDGKGEEGECFFSASHSQRGIQQSKSVDEGKEGRRRRKRARGTGREQEEVACWLRVEQQSTPGGVGRRGQNAAKRGRGSTRSGAWNGEGNRGGYHGGVLLPAAAGRKGCEGAYRYETDAAHVQFPGGE